MNIEQLQLKIKDEIAAALQSLAWFDDAIEIELEVPKDNSNGDYSSNIAMKYARVARKAPLLIAEDIVAQLSIDNLPLKEVQVAKPGFINFYLDPSFVLDTVNVINQEGFHYGDLTIGNGQHYNIEFVSVNPTGAIHIGHARGAAAGDSLARILNKAGYQVTREYYVNDAGNQINNLAKSINARYQQLFNPDYPMIDDGYFGPEIINLAKEVQQEYGKRFVDEDGEAFFRNFGVHRLLDGLRVDLDRFGVEFDIWFSEKSLYENDEVNKVVTYLKNNDFTYEKDGAIWLKTSEYGDEKDRVIIKSDGNFTYVTPDIAYHKNKLDRGYTKLIDILGSDHHGYISRLKAAIEMIGGRSDLLEVDLLQMVKVLQNGEEVKMSKRSGKAITLGDLIDEVGADPIRYFFAARSLNSQMDLDLDLAIRQTNENPVYYVQYAHARIHSIFEKASVQGIDFDHKQHTFKTIDNDKTIELVVLLSQYPAVIKSAAESRQPHRLVNYIYQVATAFHSFYNSDYVIQDDQLKTQERLAILNACQIVLQNALSLIGVSAPEKM
ncbi:arginine--tRNA ligase [Candidatus Xianfuyuplasma coldseepsis]|uniref:Arginine--tRNA ligase n=1 Tax=Candidatus Xianfuyuplasma coldseepsis TaxID=2782163 RepID=A0A7L7KTF9_9MOLU|nr:arginine--tRNA ligase [Xianfuyuplasma coldseepsis]QMS85895.1 arginine--tRNA ligase [Xianfuyuplasma coldseepsis]